ncbi:hypothetical protein AVEN_197314-1 [Araneus ventricosus]|uniref:Reverse transcriptase domain-containing protein n=1 Tax=Araneus ventricosus TaxID=182803 RepID=A0A4Y2EXI4_ARAVE|nr:hypothetical protein AVEN_197314-1 [Araneus ventricosus]
MNGKLVTVSNNFRYLGLWRDSSLTFTEHFNKVRRKVDLLSYRISTVAERFYSRHAKLFYRIYRGAIEPFILYGHGAWGHRLNLQKIKNTLNSIQWRPLIKLTGAFRKVSTVALQVIAGILPLDLKSIDVFSRFLALFLKQNVNISPASLNFRDFENRTDIFDLHPLQWRPIPFG